MFNLKKRGGPKVLVVILLYLFFHISFLMIHFIHLYKKLNNIEICTGIWANIFGLNTFASGISCGLCPSLFNWANKYYNKRSESIKNDTEDDLNLNNAGDRNDQLDNPRSAFNQTSSDQGMVTQNAKIDM